MNPSTPDHPMPASEAAPIYRKVRQKPSTAYPYRFLQLWYVTCDNGNDVSSVVCEGMTEPVADWLLGVLGRQPFAPETRRGV